MTTYDLVMIDGIDRKSDALGMEITRNVNAVGNWNIVLRNTTGKFNGLFDVQDSFLVQVDSPPHAIIGGRVDGRAVTLRSRDLESVWDEYCILKGVDMSQDLLFHNDFDGDYPDATQQLKAVMDDVFNTQLAGLTNISYTPPVGATPVVGAIEFKEGASFLTQLQEMHKRAGYVFYVDDGLVFRSGAPGFSASGMSFYSSPGVSNIIDIIDYQERDGDKHYNYVKLYGKNPMFDGWTEYNVAYPAITAPNWGAEPAFGGAGVCTASDETTTFKIGAAAIKCTRNSGNFPSLFLDIANGGTGRFNYHSLDLSKGTIGMWVYYDGGDDQIVHWIEVTDITGNVLTYYSNHTRVLKGYWGWIEAPIGVDPIDVQQPEQWWNVVTADLAFDWSQVTKIRIISWAVTNMCNYFIIDGITLPVPCVSIIENVAAQGVYRRRPFTDTWAHLRTQNSLDAATATLLPQVQSTAISNIKFTTPGDYRLRYAGQSFDLDIPSLGINNEVFYATNLHHIIEPMVDVSGGFSFDWVMEVEGCPVGGVTYDASRLGTGPNYSSYQMAMRSGVGTRIK